MATPSPPPSPTDDDAATSAAILAVLDREAKTAALAFNCEHDARTHSKKQLLMLAAEMTDLRSQEVAGRRRLDDDCHQQLMYLRQLETASRFSRLVT